MRLLNIRAISMTVLLVSAGLAVSGCRKYGKSLALPPKPSLPYLYSLDDYKADIAIYNKNAPDVNDDSKQLSAKAARNNIAWGLMGSIDDLYNVYSSGLYSGKGAIAIAGDSSTLGLTAAAAIARQVATKTIFGALGTAIAGVNLSVDKNLFAQQTYQVIALAMETRRTTLFNEISDGLSKKSVLEYPLSAVKRDLVLYLYAGSLPGGLQEIQKEAGAASATADSMTKPAGAPTQPVFKISTNSLPDGATNMAYAVTLQGTGGTPPLRWSVSPALPTGLALDSSKGIISGTPTAASPKSTYTFTATDNASPPATAKIDLTLQIK